jgi:hypothetical protein
MNTAGPIPANLPRPSDEYDHAAAVAGIGSLALDLPTYAFIAGATVLALAPLIPAEPSNRSEYFRLL